MRRWYPPLVAGVAVWLSCWLYATRLAMLDDALIHLRYASNLRNLHFITYDGVTPTFGTSSLLYVGILALLRSFTTSPLLPKMVSDVAYVCLIGLVLVLIHRLRASQFARMACLGLLACLLSPMGVRWLTDGMETSLVVLAACLLALLAHHQMQRNSTPTVLYVPLVFFGACLALLRIELASLVALASLAIATPRLAAAPDWKSRVKALLTSSHLSVGVLVVMATLHHVYGSLLPDTAIAKATSISMFVEATTVARTVASSFLLGMGSALLWVATAFFLLRAYLLGGARASTLIAWACANAPFPLIVSLAAARGQGIDGVRYFIWCFVFSTVWNVLALDLNAQERQAPDAQDSSWLRIMVPVYVAFLVCIGPPDWYYGHRTMQGRGSTYAAMRNAGLGTLKGRNLVAGDIGFIGYFSQANVCDLSGLVNGRAFARTDSVRRVDVCASRNPTVLFVRQDEARDLSKRMDLREWVVCQRFDFQNVHSLDRHYLVLPPRDAAQKCPSMGGPLGLLANIVPGVNVSGSVSLNSAALPTRP